MDRRVLMQFEERKARRARFWSSFAYGFACAATMMVLVCGLVLLVSGCTETTVVCGVDELDGSVELDARPPSPHPHTQTSMHAKVHDMCATSFLTELVCGLPTELCIDRCFVPHDGRTEAHYYAVRECLHALQPLTCEGWHACMELP